nr:conserved hypothetical protein [uncultured archaeon]
MTAKIDKIFLERHSTKLSLAVSLLDDYSKGKPIGRVEVSLKGRKEKPVKNLSSYYLFLKLPDDSYTVQVRSDFYFDEELDIDLAGFKEPTAINLKPKPSYPFSAGATLIRGAVANTGITAKIKAPKEKKKAVIFCEGDFCIVPAGTSSIRLAEADINKDDAYMIMDSNKTRIEFCRITDIPADPSNNPYSIEKPLRFEHADETPLHKMVEERTLDVKHTEKGEFVSYFSMVKSYKTLVDLEISYPDHTEKIIRDIEVEEGKTTSLKSDEL